MTSGQGWPSFFELPAYRETVAHIALLKHTLEVAEQELDELIEKF